MGGEPAVADAPAGAGGAESRPGQVAAALPRPPEEVVLMKQDD